MPTLPHGRLWVLSASIVMSCVVMGLSISLLITEIPSMDPYTDPSGAWQQPPDSNPNPRRGLFFSSSDSSPSDEDEFHISEILAIVASALNLLVATALIVISSMKRKTIISAVAVEAPCIYIVSFMWLSTAAYAAYIGEGNLAYIPYLPPHECARHKVLQGIAFLNWIQLMLYANTLVTVATICHVRRRPVWFHPVTELPTLGAPALTFDRDSQPEMAPFMTQTNESEAPILGNSRSNVNPRAPSHFRSRLTFPQHSIHQTGRLSPLSSSPLPNSESVESLAPSVLSVQADVPSSQNPVRHSQLRTYPRIVPMGEPPTYSDPGAGYQSEPV